MTLPSFSLEGRVAIITGARRGMGKAMALAFAESGANVAVCDKVIEDGQLEAVATEIRKFGRRSLAIKIDTSSRSDVESMVERVVREFGCPDILVNDAAFIVRKPLLDHEEAEWDRVIDVDLKGYFLCAQAVAKRMLLAGKRGNMINMASRGAFQAQKNSGAYDIAKAGVVMMTKMLAMELAGHGIRVNAIAPGPMRTDFNEDMRKATPDMESKVAAMIPLGRWGQASDIVGAALLLASDASSFITGHVILVDGGLMA